MRTSLLIILCMVNGTAYSSQNDSSQKSIEQETFDWQDISWTEYRGKYKDYTKSVEKMNMYHLVGVIKVINFQKPTEQNIIHWRLKKIALKEK